MIVHYKFCITNLKLRTNQSSYVVMTLGVLHFREAT